MEKEDLCALATVKRERILQFIRESGQIKAIQQQCIQWLQSEQTESILRLVVPIDPKELLQFDCQLFELVVHTPHHGQRLLQKALFSFITDNGWLENVIECAQLVVVVEITYLPPFPGYVINNLWKCPSYKFLPRFYRFDGIIIETSSVSLYTQCAKYICPAETCHSGKISQIRHHLLGTSEVNTVRNDLVCPYCAALLIEDPTFRMLGEKIITQMTSIDALTSYGSMFQSLTVVFRGIVHLRFVPVHTSLEINIIALHIENKDHLIGEAQLGRELSLIMLPTYTYCGNIRKISLESTETTPQPFPKSTLVPEFPRIEGSPWTFSLGLAFKFGGNPRLSLTTPDSLCYREKVYLQAEHSDVAHIVPAGTFHRLKLGMLLSLVGSGQREGHQTTALLAVSHNSLILHRLLYYGSRFVPRFICHSATTPLKVAVSKDSSKQSAYIFHAGSLLLSHSGVCFLGNLNRLNKTNIQFLTNVLENGYITADIPAGEVLLKPIAYPLTCQIWAIMEPDGKKDNTACQDTGFVVSSLLKPLSESFGILYEIDAADKTDDDILVEHTLRVAVEDISEIKYQEHIIKQHIESARAIVATFSPNAERIIHGYFVGSRRVRKCGVSDTEIPLIAVKTVSLLAETHAQINLREKVLEEDVIIAILLYEESITAKVGYSLPSLKPTLHKSRNYDLNAYLDAEVSKLLQFQKLLHQFIANYAGDALEPSEE